MRQQLRRPATSCSATALRRAATFLGTCQSNHGNSSKAHLGIQTRFVSSAISKPFEALNFVTPSMLAELPVDRSEETLQRKPRQVLGSFSSIVEPTPLANPELVSFSPPAAELLDLDPKQLQDHSLDFAKYFSGNVKMEGAEGSYAHCYGGHQFGSWAGQLGDGRAITIAEIINKRNERWEISLKGSGLTPYSRFADGRAVMRSSIREFLASEAMAALHIPTTRALSLISSSDKVARDEFYNGNIKYETCAVVCRLAPTFIRFGSFEIFYMRGESNRIKQLADFVIKYHYSHLQNQDSTGNTPEVYEKFYTEVVQRTARLAAMWQSVGFAHGVLNTDNMSILGWTIDYGPYGFLDAYRPDFVPNHSDFAGRYAFANQPGICKWNLGKLGQTMLPMMSSIDRAQQALNTFDMTFMTSYYSLMKKKLGLIEQGEAEGKDEEFVLDFLTLLDDTKADFTRSFRLLSDIKKASPGPEDERLLVDILPVACKLDPEHEKMWKEWLTKYRDRLQREKSSDGERKAMMDSVNPKFVLRNHLAQRAIERAEGGDYQEVKKLLGILLRPFDEHADVEEVYAQPPGTDSPKICVSCSS